MEVTLTVLLPKDCPFDIEGEALKCKIVFPSEYPTEMCTINVLNEDIPARLRGKVAAAVQKRAATAYKGNPAMASGLLRWMRNNVDTLLVDTLITQEYVTGIKLDVFDSTKTKSYVIEDDPALFQYDMVKLPQTHGGKEEVIKASVPQKSNADSEKEGDDESKKKDENEKDNEEEEDNEEEVNDEDDDGEEEDGEEEEEEEKKSGKP